MKSKELIEQLLKADPNGEFEVVAAGIPIYFASRQPAYYDGALKILIQDKTSEHYNITGFKYTHQGNKIQLHLMDIDDVLLNDPDLLVDISEVTEHSKDRISKSVEETRSEMKSIKDKYGKNNE